MAAKKTNTTKRYTTAPRTATKPAETKSTPTTAELSAAVAVETKAAPQVAAAAVAAPAVEITPKTPEHKAMSKGIVSDLIASLRGTSAESACEAATALGASDDSSAVEPLAEALINANGYFHSIVRAAAAASLGQLKHRDAVPALIEGIRDEMAEASAESVRALASLGDPRAIAPLIGVVENRDGFFLPVVRRAAVLALHKLGGTEAAACIAHVARDQHEEPAVRAAATSPEAI